ncbi:hypothetical protein QYE76_031683 [Lolium multiflorum]|uniref:CCHC-type domain-containing protein n=1 Tax=Lolium multiflorum TaxID=4521 RepID=A0AAD8QS45_LOLMU|nr:hypothetical protein QYE76_031683 [Lolium multiflorum]
MVSDMKISHGRAREEREACTKEGEEEVQAGSTSPYTGWLDPDRTTDQCPPGKFQEERPFGPAPRPAPPNATPGGSAPTGPQTSAHRKKKDDADLVSWREYEALRDDVRREFRRQGNDLKEEIQDVGKNLEATNETVNTIQTRTVFMVTLKKNSLLMSVVLVVVLGMVSVVVVLSPSEPAVFLHNRKTMVWLTLLRQGTLTVDAYFIEMEMLMQRGRVRESLEMMMQRFLHGPKYTIKGIVRHHCYTNMNELLHHAREAEAQLAEEAQIKGHAMGAGHYTSRAPPSTAPTPSSRPATFPTSSSKSVSNVSNTKKPKPAASGSGSSMSTARNRDMACHTCGGKGHFKKDCPNRNVMIINEDDEYETGDDADPDAPEDDEYDSDGADAYTSEARTIIVSQRALNVQPSASTQCCNLFQTKALVGPDKACKVIIDGGSFRNLASKELCAKLKLKYLLHPHPYYIQWLSDNGEI